MLRESSPRDLDVSLPTKCGSQTHDPTGYEVTAESIVFPDGDELPWVGEPSRRILEPLTDRQLAASLRQARLDRREDVCGRAAGGLLSWHWVRAAETLAEWPDGTEEELL